MKQGAERSRKQIIVVVNHPPHIQNGTTECKIRMHDANAVEALNIAMGCMFGAINVLRKIAQPPRDLGPEKTNTIIKAQERLIYPVIHAQELVRQMVEDVLRSGGMVPSVTTLRKEEQN